MRKSPQVATWWSPLGGLQPTSSLRLTVALGAVQVAMDVVAVWAVGRPSRRAVFGIGYLIAAVGALFGFVNIALLHQNQ